MPTLLLATWATHRPSSDTAATDASRSACSWSSACCSVTPGEGGSVVWAGTAAVVAARPELGTVCVGTADADSGGSFSPPTRLPVVGAVCATGAGVDGEDGVRCHTSQPATPPP